MMSIRLAEGHVNLVIPGGSPERRPIGDDDISTLRNLNEHYWSAARAPKPDGYARNE